MVKIRGLELEGNTTIYQLKRRKKVIQFMHSRKERSQTPPQQRPTKKETKLSRLKPNTKNTLVSKVTGDGNHDI